MVINQHYMKSPIKIILNGASIKKWPSMSILAVIGVAMIFSGGALFVLKKDDDLF